MVSNNELQAEFKGFRQEVQALENQIHQKLAATDARLESFESTIASLKASVDALLAQQTRNTLQQNFEVSASADQGQKLKGIADPSSSFPVQFLPTDVCFMQTQERTPRPIGSLLPPAQFRRQERFDRLDLYDATKDITKKVRVDVPDFDGRIDPQAFSDWLATLERYFEWYDMPDERKVRFTTMKLVGQAQIWWSGIEYENQIQGLPTMNWEEMKLCMKRKYLPFYYQYEIFMTVIKYMNKFE